MKRASTCRLRKVACDRCGYTARITRSWLEVGLPGCPCGGTLEPTDGADRAFCGMIGIDNVPAVEWTRICRENGWEDSIIRRGAAAKAHDRRELEAGGFAGRRVGAAHCVFAGCGRWVAADADRCTAGHAQHEPALEAALPF